MDVAEISYDDGATYHEIINTTIEELQIIASTRPCPWCKHNTLEPRNETPWTHAKTADGVIHVRKVADASESKNLRVFICSRYAGDIDHNVDMAKKLCRFAIDLGYVPFAPHLLYPQFLDDVLDEDRRAGIACGHAFMETCAEVWVFQGDGVSEGMEADRLYAQKKDILTRYIHLFTGPRGAESFSLGGVHCAHANGG